MKKKRSFSIRYKLLLLLVSLPVGALLFYLLLATSLFKNDKLAYIFDSSTAVSRTLASQVRAASDALVNSEKPIFENFNWKKHRFELTARKIFDSDPTVSYFAIFQTNEFNHYVKVAELKKSIPGVEEEKLSSDVMRIADQARVNKRSLGVLNPDGEFVIFGDRHGDPDKPHHIMVVSIYKNEPIIRAFRKIQMYSSFLIENSGEVVLGPENMKFVKDFGSWEFYNRIKTKNLPEGTSESKSPEGKTLLMSYAQVGMGGLTVLSFVQKELAFRAVGILLGKSILFFTAIVSIAIIVSVFSSRKLTSTLRALFLATQSVSEGKYDVNVHVDSADEVGTLAENFNKMAGEISRLMKETASKARMEKELETAKTVQETLFPPSNSLERPLKISGFYQPAGECGGDWWHYGRIGNKTFVWIGDATGHGAPAALITSAAKSAASIIEILGSVTPAVAMQLLNRAIYQTSRGKMLMTFFLGAFDETTGEFTYCNASHDPPFLLRHTGQPLTKSDLITLNDVNNPRLGQKPDTVFKETKITINTNDVMIFYTDGVLDLHNPAAEPWGERKFIKTVLSVASQNQKVEQTMADLTRHIIEYRKGAELIDDVTCFVCKYERAA